METDNVALLTSGELTDEQRFARSVAREPFDIETVAISTIESAASLEEYDVVWWQRATPVDDDTLSHEVRAALEAYVRDGGALLLGLHAMTAVAELGIEPRPPDGVDETYKPIHKWAQRPAGFLVKSRVGDSPLFERYDGLRIHTQPSRNESVPRITYRHRVPKRGTVYASAIVGDVDVPEENSIIAWQCGDGRVLGIGQHFSFDAAVPEYEPELRSLLAGIAEFFAQPVDESIGARPYSGAELEAVRETLDEDHRRPTYHFAPPANWLNDPNGLVEWNGRYHLFYQYNPAGPYHGSIHWGHAVSEDLVHWEDKPVALEPEVGGPDRHGCWSGCTIVDDGRPTFVYTGGDGNDQLPCLARAADDELETWTKHPENPVIESAPDEPEILSNDDWNAEFRDHDVWRRGDVWYQLIGSGVEDEGGAALLFRSSDLTDWEYVGPALVGDRRSSGPIWECPELLDFGDAQVLQVSNYDAVVYFVGSFDGESFTPERQGTLDHGNYYAAQSIPDGDRYLSWGWIREDRSSEAQWDAGWSGVMSVPRSITIDDGELRVRPAAELTNLRDERVSVSNRTLTPATDGVASELEGDALEIRAEFELETADAFELTVLESPDGAERTTVRYERPGSLVIDRSQSSRSDAAADAPQTIDAVPASDDDRITLRLLVDGSVLEVFVNERTAVSSRVYPTRTDSTGVSLASVNGTSTLHAFDAWTLSSIFTDGRVDSEFSSAEVNVD